MKDQNPANEYGTTTERNRIPMSVPKQSLEVNEIPGYVMYWFADRPGRIQRAQAAGYEFVDPSEVTINNGGFANDVLQSGNSDLGAKISVVGGRGDNGQAERLYLMKIKREWWEKDQEAVEVRNEAVAAAIRGGAITGGAGELSDDKQHRYGGQQLPARKAQPNLFTPKRR